MKLTNKQLEGLFVGLVTIAFGIILAICGFSTAINIYFGIMFVLAAAACLCFNCFLFVTTKHFGPSTLVLGGVSLAVAIGLFNGFINFGYILPLIIAALIGGASAFILLGIHQAVKLNVYYGLGKVLVGAAVVTLCALFLNLPGFEKWFFVIVGILIALYGLFTAVFSVVNKKEEK